MKKIGLVVGCWLMAAGLLATEIKSPNGNVVLNFNVEQGRPVYTLTYKGRPVIKPSHLGLELAKDKHASNGARLLPFVIIITSMLLYLDKLQNVVKSFFVFVSMMMG